MNLDFQPSVLFVALTLVLGITPSCKHPSTGSATAGLQTNITHTADFTYKNVKSNVAFLYGNGKLQHINLKQTFPTGYPEGIFKGQRDFYSYYDISHRYTFFLDVSEKSNLKSVIFEAVSDIRDDGTTWLGPDGVETAMLANDILKGLKISLSDSGVQGEIGKDHAAEFLSDLNLFSQPYEGLASRANNFAMYTDLYNSDPTKAYLTGPFIDDIVPYAQAQGADSADDPGRASKDGESTAPSGNEDQKRDSGRR